jgi:preprotein translocase subunit SecF
MSRIGQIGHRLYTGEVSYDFVGRKKTWYAISAAILLLAILGLLFRGLNFGIEFRGGAEFRVPAADCSVEQAREAIGDSVTVEPIVQKLGNGEIRVQTEELTGGAADDINSALAEECGVAENEITRQVIGATWGGEVTNRALLALVVFLALVVVFISIMFEFKMAIAAFVALLHDLVITIGLYALIGFEVTPATVIGMLTILGYSLYDTIVVFDSLRENTRGLQGGSRMTYSDAANLSVNQTLVRSINTSVIALLPVGAILFVGAYALGAGVLKDLSLVLFIGIAASTLSSIFIATPLLADLKEREPAMKALRKRVDSRRASGAPTRRRPAAAAAPAPAAAGSAGATAVTIADIDGAPEDDASEDDDLEARATAGGTGVRPAGTPGRPRQQPRRGGTNRRPSGKKKR